MLACTALFRLISFFGAGRTTHLLGVLKFFLAPEARSLFFDSQHCRAMITINVLAQVAHFD